jgi:sn-glycerol 3-phosphate transport system substrate-binding protein
MDTAEEAVNELVAAFNASQDAYRIEPRYVGAYAEAQTRLIAAFGSQDEPALFQAEIGFFPRLVGDGAVQDLTPLMETLPEGFAGDFLPGLWTYGELDGRRYGLPWNSSTPVLYYNVDALRRAGIDPPATWPEFVAAAQALTSRQAQGVVFVGDSWLFEMIVLSLGGRLADAEGNPTLDAPEALEALTMLDELERSGALAFFGADETTPAILGFVRTRSLMAFASISNWPDVSRFSVAFEMNAAPVPLAEGGAVPLGGAQLVVMANASDTQREGAFAFWRFLMEPANLASWIEASYYVPLRRSVLPLLSDFYAEAPGRDASRSQLEIAIPRPRTAEFDRWRVLIDEALERTLRGRTSPEQALADAQRAALEGR